MICYAAKPWVSDPRFFVACVQSLKVDQNTTKRKPHRTKVEKEKRYAKKTKQKCLPFRLNRALFRMSPPTRMPSAPDGTISPPRRKRSKEINNTNLEGGSPAPNNRYINAFTILWRTKLIDFLFLFSARYASLRHVFILGNRKDSHKKWCHQFSDKAARRGS